MMIGLGKEAIIVITNLIAETGFPFLKELITFIHYQPLNAEKGRKGTLNQSPRQVFQNHVIGWIALSKAIMCRYFIQKSNAVTK